MSTLTRVVAPMLQSLIKLIKRSPLLTQAARVVLRLLSARGIMLVGRVVLALPVKKPTTPVSIVPPPAWQATRPLSRDFRQRLVQELQKKENRNA